MKARPSDDPRVIRKLMLALEILEKQKELWTLRAEVKKLRIAEVRREIESRSPSRTGRR